MKDDSLDGREVTPLSQEFLKKRIVPIDIEGIDTISGILSAFSNTLIGAGIAWAWEKDKKYGLVAETHGYMDQKALKEILEWKVREMAKIREIEINEISYRFENLMVPMDNYGCVVAALVYIP